jgi:hypothetical protein
MTLTKKTLASIFAHAVSAGFPIEQISLQSDRLSLWIGEDDETWNEADDTYTSLVGTVLSDILSSVSGLTSIGNGLKFDIVAATSDDFGDYNDVSAKWHY